MSDTGSWKPAKRYGVAHHPTAPREGRAALECVQRWQDAALRSGDMASAAESLDWQVQMLVAQGERQQASAHIEGFEHVAQEQGIEQLIPWLAALRKKHLG